MRFNTRLFVILWLAGLAGVLSFLLVDLDALIKILPIPAGTEIPTITPALKLLSMIQPAVILSIAVLVGVALAPKVGLSSPVAEAAASGGDLASAFKPQIIPGILGGLAGGVAIILIALVSKPFLSPEIVARISEFGKSLPLPTRLLYGGITEELLLRWGLMTLLVWAAWQLFQKGQDRPKLAFFVGAILISSLVFGIGHLPVAFMLFPEPTLALTLFVIVGNSAFGLIAGYLYWRKGLESAMLAHDIGARCNVRCELLRSVFLVLPFVALPRTAAQQAVAARRLDSSILKHLPKVQVGGCSLGAAEPPRSANARLMVRLSEGRLCLS